MASSTSKNKAGKRCCWTFKSPAEMRRWAGHFARSLRTGDVVALVGELGSGKTTLVQGIAAAWGYKRGASSPTFALANEYQTPRGAIYHLDMYRLSDKEIAAFPLEEYFRPDALCMIEWADRVRDRWPEDTVEIRLKQIDETTRLLTVRSLFRRGVPADGFEVA